VSTFAPPVQRLVAELSRLPGIGTRTAQRLAFHLLRASDEEATALAQAILDVKARIGLCDVCFNLTDAPRCRICGDLRRDHGVICVVEEPADVIPLERTHEFDGVYHVLGGALSPIDGVDPEDLRIAELYARVVRTSDDTVAPGAASSVTSLDGAVDTPPDGADAPPADGTGGLPSFDVDGPVREVVLATNPTTTGEATALHIAQELHERAPALRVTRLASGLPVGADLEYADEVTLGKALSGRRVV
jgi:recombination protein RecR